MKKKKYYKIQITCTREKSYCSSPTRPRRSEGNEGEREEGLRRRKERRRRKIRGKRQSKRNTSGKEKRK